MFVSWRQGQLWHEIEPIGDTYRMGDDLVVSVNKRWISRTRASVGVGTKITPKLSVGTDIERQEGGKGSPQTMPADC